MSKLKGYATSTTTLKNIEFLKNLGWGLFITPDRPEVHSFKDFAIDNGAWSAYSRKVSWHKKYEKRFRLICDVYGEMSDFIVCPDIVAGGYKSLDLSLSYLDHLKIYGTKILIPVQDGIQPCSELYSVLSSEIGLFIGGTTNWKLHNLPTWSWVSEKTNCYLHVARVNSCKRMALCASFKVNSFDGTSLSRYSVDAIRMNNCRLRLIKGFYEDEL